MHLIIKQFDSTKYLGITFGSNLTWKSHINELCLKHIKNSRYLVKSETFCWQPYSCHALLLSHLSFPHLWCPCLGFNPSLISNTIIYYPEKSNQNNIFLRTKIPFWASVQISQLTYKAQWYHWITDTLFCLPVVTQTVTPVFQWIFQIYFFCSFLFSEAIM